MSATFKNVQADSTRLRYVEDQTLFDSKNYVRLLLDRRCSHQLIEYKYSMRCNKSYRTPDFESFSQDILKMTDIWCSRRRYGKVCLGCEINKMLYNESYTYTKRSYMLVALKGSLWIHVPPTRSLVSKATKFSKWFWHFTSDLSADSSTSSYYSHSFHHPKIKYTIFNNRQ